MIHRPYVVSLVLLAIFIGLAALTVSLSFPSSSLDEAQRFYARGDVRNALRRSLDHLTRRPWDRAAARLAATCLSRLDFATAAEPYYEQGGGWAALDLEQAGHRAYGLVRANRRREAVDAYTRLLERWPDDPNSLQRFATLLMTMKRFPDALATARRLAEIRGHEVVGYALLGTISHQDRTPEDSAAYYEKALELDPTIQRIPFGAEIFWPEFVGDLIEAGRLGDAARHVGKALARSPRDPLLLDLQGKVSYQLGEIPAAESAWKSASELAPSRAGPWLGLGQVALSRNQLAEADQLLRKAAELDPKDPDSRYLLSLVERRRGHVKEAEELRLLSEELRRKYKPLPRGMGEMPSKSRTMD